MLPDREVLERMQFVQFQPMEDDAGSTSANVGKSASGEYLTEEWLYQCSLSNQNIAGWVPAWVPEGFVAIEASTEMRSGYGRLVYSDGVGVLTILVEPISSVPFPTATAQRGASSVHVGYIKLGERVFMVTVAGEVPEQVVENVARSMTFTGTDATASSQESNSSGPDLSATEDTTLPSESGSANQ
jgi:negative regulator of sigma E activity